MQTGAIVDHLAHKHPEAGLAGGDNMRAIAEAYRLVGIFPSDVHASFRVIEPVYASTNERTSL